MRNIVNFFIHRSIFANLLTVIVVFAGIISFASMQREAFARVEFDIVLVNTVYPGASPLEVEKLITIPMEREIKSVEGVKKVTSTSLDNRSGIVVTLEPDVHDKNRVIQDVKDAADRAKIRFPSDVEDPVVTELSSSSTPIIEVVIAPKDPNAVDEWKLRSYADRLEDMFEEIPEVSRVSLGGYRDREIRVEVSPARLWEYNISADELVSVLSNRNLNMPGGTLDDGEKEYNIRTVKEFQESREIGDVILRQNDFGGVVKVKDVAVIKDDFEKKTMIQKANGQEAIILTVLKKESADAIDLVDKVNKVIDEFRVTAGNSLIIETMNDLSYFIRRRLNVLQGNVFVGIILVAFSLFFFLGWRIAVMVALGIPFSFAITFFLMHSMGISVNLISMFGLIIVSGMLVDDAIVVGENIYRLIEKGIDPIKAAVMGTHEMFMPVLAAVSTTMIAFAPLMFMGGIMGKFVWALPAVVIIALGASLLESFLILPSHVVDITSGSDHSKLVKKESSFETRAFEAIRTKYHRIIDQAVTHKYTTMVVAVAIFAVSLILVGITGFKLFPPGNIEIFFVKAEAKRGVSLQEMEERMRPFESSIHRLNENELDSFNTKIGIHQENPSDPFTKRGNHYAQIAVYLTPQTEREREAQDIISYMLYQHDPKKPVKHATRGRGSLSDFLIRITNKNRIDIIDPDNGRVFKSVPVDTDFIAGGGYIGDRFVAYTGRNTLIYLDPATWKVIEEMPVFDDITRIPERFILLEKSAEGLILFSNGEMVLLDLENLKEDELESYKSIVTCFQLSDDQKKLLVATAGGVVELWDIDEEGDPDKRIVIDDAPSINPETGELEVRKREDLKRVEYVSLVNDDQYIVITTIDGELNLYGIEKGDFISRRKISADPVRWVQYTGDPVSGDLWFSTNKEIIYYSQGEEKNLSSNETERGFYYPVKIRGGIALFGEFDSFGVWDKGGFHLRSRPEKEIDKLEFKEAQSGPPVGDPVSIEIRGDEFDTLLEIASTIKKKLGTIKGVYDIRDNWETGKEDFIAVIDEQKASLAGVSVMQMASSIQTAFDGKVATSIKKLEEEIDIRVIFNENDRDSLDSLNKVKIRNRIGNLVPITELAHFVKEPGISVITHDDYKRTLYVKSNLDDSRNTPIEVNAEIMKLMEPEMKKYPGYSIAPGGEVEDTRESMGNLGMAGMIAVSAIFAILVLLFGNLRHTRVIMIVIPMGFAGVAYAFFIHKMTIMPELVLSFLSVMGIIGLTGVVVNDSIVMVEFINKLRRLGFKRNEAIIYAGLNRLRPVILTSITTVFGLLPTAYGIGGGDPFLKPMALAMAWGLVFATMITLIVIPAYYSIWEDRAFVFHEYVKRYYLGGKK